MSEMEDHIGRIYFRTQGDVGQFVMAVARYCAEAHKETPATPEEPIGAVVMGFDLHHQMNNGGILEYFTKGLGGRKVLQALATIGAEAGTVRDLLAKAYEATPDHYIEAMRVAESLGDDAEADYDPGIDEEDLFDWEEGLDALDDSYYEMPKASAQMPLAIGMPPPKPIPQHPMILALYGFIAQNRMALNAAIDPVYQRLKDEGKLG